MSEGCPINLANPPNPSNSCLEVVWDWKVSRGGGCLEDILPILPILSILAIQSRPPCQSCQFYRVIQVNVFFNFALTDTKKLKKWQNPTIFVEDISGHFDILMFQNGQLKKILPFRAMSKRCKFTILQGMSTKIIPQTHPDIINVQRHHTNTIQYPQNIPKALFMHNLK